MKDRSTCEYYDRCGRTGHYLTEDHRLVRCDCLERELHEHFLGPFFTDRPMTKTPLIAAAADNAIIDGPLDTIRRHVARVMLHLRDRKLTVVTLDAYRLIEIFLEHDEEFRTQAPLLDQDLSIMLLGFGDPRNRYLPELINQYLNRRELMRKPTWVCLGIDYPQVSARYGAALATKLDGYKRLTAK